MTRTLKFRLVNVFAESPLGGNPLCVFEDGEGLDTATMQALALQFNLSETTFVLPADDPAAARRVRIFTPMFELPFAGHPTLGTAHVVRAIYGGGDRLGLQMQVGVVPVQAEGDRWTLQAGAPSWYAPQATRAQLAQMLGIAETDVMDGALWVDTGSEQLIVPLASAAAVERCRPNAELLARHSIGAKRRGLVYVWSRIDAHDIRVRFFLEKHGGVLEDPGTGSACANLGGWFVARNAPLPLAASVLQGDQVGRPCRLGLRVDAEKRIFVSGRVIALGHGEISLPQPASAEPASA
ncbi:MAG: PhzF family phenazine biosynthesis protein [Betaproteobacteria bacterium]|nr:MAG: PhzF family phenazine biosynthesis protein [Betaproteobacteria bacterium]